MRREFSALVLVILMLTTSITVLRGIPPVRSVPRTITVPDDYLTISEALKAANSGDTIFVESGVYDESGLEIRKSLHLIGQNKTTTIVDGEGFRNSIFSVISVANVTFEGFTLRNSWMSSILASQTTHLNISNNIIDGSNARGIYLAQDVSSKISKNTVTNCGIGINALGSSLSTISENNVSQCGGYCLDSSGLNDTSIYHNNIYGSAHFESSLARCDNGYPSGGNFWSEYSASDNNGDNIGDTPYVPDPDDADVQDRYPLITAFPCIHDLELESLKIETPVFNRGTVVNIEVDVKNTGHFTETLNATVRANSTIVAQINDTVLESDGILTGTFSWNTSGLSGGDYSFWAEVDQVSTETYVENNVYSYGAIRVYDVQVTELTSCTQDGEPFFVFPRGSLAYFRVTIAVGNTTPTAVLALDLNDERTIPIGVSSLRGPLTPGITTFIIGTPIPLWSTIGAAEAYFNIFTDWPHEGGVPLCFEAQAQFLIAQESGGETLAQSAPELSGNLGPCKSRLTYETQELFGRELDLTLSANSTLYFANQSVSINGQLMYESLPLSARFVAIEVRNPLGDSVIVRTVITQIDGRLSLSFSLPPYACLGNYTASASFSQFGESTTIHTLFEVAAPPLITGDLNHDGIVDILDIVIVAAAFGAIPSEHNWDSRADLNGDGVVDIIDIVVVAGHYGHTV